MDCCTTGWSPSIVGLHTEKGFLNTIKISQILQNQFIDLALTEQFYKCHNIDFVT